MNLPYPLILASKSPRRREILEKAGFTFESVSRDVDESFPEDMPKHEVAVYLALKKLKSFDGEYANHIILCSDTTVLLDDELLEKPADAAEAKQMLQKLSGRKHAVITGVAFRWNDQYHHFDDTTEVYFNKMTDAEIAHYINIHQPYDKAGAYGIQEGIGLTHIEKLVGSYFTVMGLPIHKVYQAFQAQLGSN